MGEKKNFNELRSKMGPERVARADECAQQVLEEIKVGDQLKQRIVGGPGLDGVDLDRDQSSMRGADL